MAKSFRYNSINIEVDKADLANLRRALQDVENPMLGAKEAFNSTAKEMRDKLAEQVTKAYRFKAGKSEVKRSATIHKATVGMPIATLEFHSTVKEPRDFYLAGKMVERQKVGRGLYKNRIKSEHIMSGSNPKHSVRGAILKSQNPKVLKGETGHAFIVSFKSGHVAVVTRDPNKVATKYAGRAYNKHTAKLRMWISPSPTNMVSNTKVFGTLEPDFNEMLSKKTSEAIEKRLARYGGRF